MTAAELKLPDRPKGFSWLSLAQGVYNTQVERWDMTTCGGGLRWQIFPYQAGYQLKNTISNGGLFQLAARLYRYTGDEKYLDWANKIWEWAIKSPLVNTKTWNVADSTDMPACSNQGNTQWSYNYGSFMAGAAYLYNSVSVIYLREMQNIHTARRLTFDATNTRMCTDLRRGATQMENCCRWTPWCVARNFLPRSRRRHLPRDIL